MHDDLVINLIVADADADDETIAESARQLQEELLESDVETAEPLFEGDAPDGSRAITLAVLGGILVAVKNGAGAVTAVTQLVRDWLGRRGTGTVKVTIGDDSIELSSVPTEDQAEVLREFLKRHDTAGR